MDPRFGELKASGALALNLNRVPLLTVDGVAIGGSSKAIERYLATKLGLMGDSPEAGCAIDSFCEHVRDMKDSYAAAKKVGPEQREEWIISELPIWMAKMEAFVKAAHVLDHCTGFTLADVIAWHTREEVFDHQEAVHAAFATAAPIIDASVELFVAHPAIAAYLAARPITPF